MQNSQWMQRTELMLGASKLEILNGSSVLVVGVGGVGAYAAEMLVRAGVGRLTIVDSDIVSRSNINRQLIALHSTVGRSKVEVLGERLLDINPRLQLTARQVYMKDELTFDVLDSSEFDYLVDAIDTLSPKVALIDGAIQRGIRLVSSMGAGAKTDPTKVEVRDIGDTHHCPLAHMLRKRLHKMDIHNGFWAVFSAEQIRPGAMIECDEQNKKSMVGTISYMPAVFGCAAASVVVRDLLGEMS